MNTKCYICPDEKSAMGKRKRKKTIVRFGDAIHFISST